MAQVRCRAPADMDFLGQAASFTVPDVGLTFYGAVLIATVDTLSDPSSGDLSPGADRHTAHHLVIADDPAGPQFG